MCDYNRVGGKTQNITRVVSSIWNVNVGVSVRLFLVSKKAGYLNGRGKPSCFCSGGEGKERGFLDLSAGGNGR